MQPITTKLTERAVNKLSTTKRRKINFVRALMRGCSATLRCDGLYQVDGIHRSISLPSNEVEELLREGAIHQVADEVICNTLTRNWLRRQLASDGEEFLDQHRIRKIDTEGRTVNLNESPLMRLATQSKAGVTYLKSHHVEAGERVRRLVERARLHSRVTMSYSAERTIGKPSATPTDISDMAMDARRELEKILEKLPGDCAHVVIDVCGFEKGLQQIERERTWPRRSAKLVLRIGLEQLAQEFGLSQVAVGSSSSRLNTWVSKGGHPQQFE